MIKIDTHVMLPQSRSKYPFEQMDVGDSIKFKEERQANSARIAAVRFAERHHPEWTYTLRKVEDGWRLWRVT